MGAGAEGEVADDAEWCIERAQDSTARVPLLISTCSRAHTNSVALACSPPPPRLARSFPRWGGERRGRWRSAFDQPREEKESVRHTARHTRIRRAWVLHTYMYVCVCVHVEHTCAVHEREQRHCRTEYRCILSLSVVALVRRFLGSLPTPSLPPPSPYVEVVFLDVSAGHRHCTGGGSSFSACIRLSACLSGEGGVPRKGEKRSEAATLPPPHILSAPPPPIPPCSDVCLRICNGSGVAPPLLPAPSTLRQRQTLIMRRPPSCVVWQRVQYPHSRCGEVKQPAACPPGALGGLLASPDMPGAAAARERLVAMMLMFVPAHYQSCRRFHWQAFYYESVRPGAVPSTPCAIRRSPGDRNTSHCTR